VKPEDVEMALFFGGFDGVRFFNTLHGVWPIRPSDSITMTEKRKVLKEKQIEEGVKVSYYV